MLRKMTIRWAWVAACGLPVRLFLRLRVLSASAIYGAMHPGSYNSLTMKVADAGHSSANCVVPRIASGASIRSTARYP